MESLLPLEIVKDEATPAYLPSGEPAKLEIYRKFVEFEAMPDPDKAEMMDIPMIKDGPAKGRYERIPTAGDFAKKFGVHRNTLSNWKARPEFLAAVDAAQREWGTDKLANVMASLYRRCVRYGISTDVELYLAYYKNWDRKQVIKHMTEKFDSDDIRSLLAPLPKAKQDEFYALITRILNEAELLRGSGEV